MIAKKRSTFSRLLLTCLRLYDVGGRPTYLPGNLSTKVCASICLNCNCNCGICIAPHTGRVIQRAHHKTITSLYPGVRRQTVTKTFSVGDESSGRPQQLQFCRHPVPCSRFVDGSAARRGHQTTKRIHRQLMSVSLICRPACVQEATCGP